MKLFVLSCDRYEPCWKPFFALLEKYYKNHPEAYLITETKTCPYCKTINVNSNIWTERFREGLKQIDDDEVLIMLDDFFIRDYVNEERIKQAERLIKTLDNVACFNFEKKYRKSMDDSADWCIQFNNQIYLNSCQPSIWNRRILIDRLQQNQNAQEWELTQIDSPYLHFINNRDFIIDIGYRHQDLSIGFGITRGKLSKECLDFLKKEGLDEDIVNHYSLL